MAENSFKRRKNGRGGARKNAGRKASAFKELCANELMRNNGEIVRKMGQIAAGKFEFDKPFYQGGQMHVAKVKPTAADMQSAATFLRDSGFGKPAQALEHSGPSGENLVVKLVNYGEFDSPI